MATTVKDSIGVAIAGEHAFISQKVSLREGDPIGGIDLDTLAIELDRLRLALKARGSEPDHDIAVAAVALAERAASKGNKSELAGHLKVAGVWAFGVAKELALSVVSGAIERSISG